MRTASHGGNHTVKPDHRVEGRDVFHARLERAQRFRCEARQVTVYSRNHDSLCSWSSRLKLRRDSFWRVPLATDIPLIGFALIALSPVGFPGRLRRTLVTVRAVLAAASG